MLLLMAFKKLIKKIMEWKRQDMSNNIASTNSYRKEKLLEFFSTYNTTNDIFVFLRLLVAIHICSHSDQYEVLIPELNDSNSLKDWCFRVVTQPREFTDHLMMTALATALGVTLRLERLYGGGSDQDNMYTGPGAVSVILLYTGNHYDIIYPSSPAVSSIRQASQGEDPAG
uniref:Uncharacterized protein n=1 Tax=Avena sativa TaxID=4498 RepID=A0ACD5W8Z0_AVESA